MRKPGKQTDVEQIRKGLGHLRMRWSPAAWLDTGVPDLNAVLGHREKGLCYGRIIEISGLSSHGKTAIALILAQLAQQDGAKVIWEDLESSFDEDWATERGLSVAKISAIQPYVGRFSHFDPKKGRVVQERDPRMSTAEELCAETESLIKANAVHYEKQILVVDSVAAMLTEYEAECGIEGQNMKAGYSLPVFMGRLLRRWVGLAQAHSVLIVLLNQLRSNPMNKYEPWTTPGGNAIHFYAHARVRIRRAGGGKIITAGRMSGMEAIMTNFKSKFGYEGAKVGFRFHFKGPVQFVDAKELIKKKEDK